MVCVGVDCVESPHFWWYKSQEQGYRTVAWYEKTRASSVIRWTTNGAVLQIEEILTGISIKLYINLVWIASVTQCRFHILKNKEKEKG